MYEYGPEFGSSWPRRRDGNIGEPGFGASVAVDDPLTERHCQASEHRIHPIVEPPPSELVQVEPRFLANKQARRQLKRDAYQAYVALKTAAERDGIPASLLTIVSAHRSVAHQRQLWEQALHKYGSPERARIWVAPPGSSAHHTGRAIDFWLGSGLSSKNLEAMRSSPAYRWLVCNGVRFGFSPYAAEPWHWEFTPPGSVQPRTVPLSSMQFPGRARRYVSEAGVRTRVAPRRPTGNETATQPVGFAFYGQAPARRRRPAPPVPPPVALPGFSPAEEKALRITTTFETGRPLNFSGLTGNFDGQGVSLGLLQWNFGTGSLQPLLRRFATESSARFDEIFGPDAARFRELLQPHRTRAEQMDFARSINDAHNQIVEPWHIRFNRVTEDPGFRQIQLNAVRPRMDAAERDARRLGLTTERGLSMMFDNVTQNGPSWLEVHIGRTATAPGTTRATMLQERTNRRRTELGRNLTDRERLEMIANLVADTSSPRWKEDVRQRRMTIVNGTGIVHGTHFDLGRQFGLTDQTWTAGTPAAHANSVPPHQRRHWSEMEDRRVR
jgi:hypothetical protein